MDDILRGVHELESIRVAIQVIMVLLIVQTGITITRFIWD